MTLDEFGVLVKRTPKVREHYTDEELSSVPAHVLAHKVLAAFPHYWDMISPAARRIYELSQRSTESTAWFESTRVENRAGHIANNLAEAQSMHVMDMLVEASSHRLPLEVYAEKLRKEHEADIQLHVERERASIGLDAKNRQLLTAHELLADLQFKLMELIERRDAETHADKKDVLNTRIKHLKAELDARGQQAVVQAGGGSGLRRPDEDTDGPRDGGKGDAADVESVSRPRNRVGF